MLLSIIVTVCPASSNFAAQAKIETLQDEYVDYIERCKKAQIKRVKHAQVGTRNTMLYFNFLSEMKNLVFHVVNLYKSQRDFVNYKNNSSSK